MPIALSAVVAAAIVVGFGLGPSTLGPRPPVAEPYTGDAARPPSYGSRNAGLSARNFERAEETKDPPDKILDFFDRAIDRKTWTVASRGRSNIALVLHADPRVRGGVTLESSTNGTQIRLFAQDMQLPAGFPEDFPVPPGAHPIDARLVSATLFHLRWDVPSWDFPNGFAVALEDAGWQIVAKSPGNMFFSLTCRSRARPEVTCRVVPRGGGTSSFFFPSQAIVDVWVGPGADRTN